MELIGDLQLHSRYSRAVSKYMVLSEIARFATRKGIGLVATGDWTHPLWFTSIKQELVEANQGIFKMRDGSYPRVSFLLGTEISSIYSDKDKVRRIHNLIFSPSISVCEKIISELQKRKANLASDGRPVVGISSRDLLALILDANSDCMMIPAHAWTPWFGLYGSKSGYDSLDECFGNLSSNIYAIETGLSSDPRMNWQIAELDQRSIVSFSDAHSGIKMGREATVFQGTSDFTYNDVMRAIKQDSSSKLKLAYTIEFFPEKGKYHWSGHREHNLRLSPAEIKRRGEICPICRKPLTIGVENRVLSIALRALSASDVLYEQNDVGVTFVYDSEKKRLPYVSSIPLDEIIKGVVKSPTKGMREYERLTQQATEFDILLHLPIAVIAELAGSQIARAIQKVRLREVEIDPGYDGVFGTVHIPQQHSSVDEKLSLF